MVKILFKTFMFLICFAILGGAVMSVMWFKDDVIKKEEVVREELKEMRDTVVEPHDFSIDLFDQAISALENGDVAVTRAVLTEILRFHREGAKGDSALRLLGELNMDQLMTPDESLGKKSIEVQPGQSVNGIAKSEQCTYHYIARVNGLTRASAIQPHDRLWVCPLDFKVVLRLESSLLFLMRDDKFFKAYDLVGVNRPPGLRVPFKTKISDKKAMVNGKQILLSSDDYQKADKWIDLGSNLSLRATEDDGSVPDRAFGVFLDESDIDELMTVLRVGNAVEVNP